MAKQTFTAKDGTTYKYRKVDGIIFAPHGSWKGETKENGYPQNENDKEFDNLVDVYISESEFDYLTDEELAKEYENI